MGIMAKSEMLEIDMMCPVYLHGTYINSFMEFKLPIKLAVFVLLLLPFLCSFV